VPSWNRYPLVSATVQAADSAFTVLAVDIDTDGPNQTIRVRADLAQPIIIGGRTFVPFRQGSDQRGWYEVNLTLGGAMEYSLLVLIVVMAWPANRWQEWCKRVVISVPLALGLLLVNVATTFPAELWNPIHNEWVPDVAWPLLIWSRVLMGGGGLMFGLLCGAIAIKTGTDKSPEVSDVGIASISI
jgi:hypothetical protein